MVFLKKKSLLSMRKIADLKKWLRVFWVDVISYFHSWFSVTAGDGIQKTKLRLQTADKHSQWLAGILNYVIGSKPDSRQLS